jgi:hypothetical protein
MGVARGSHLPHAPGQKKYREPGGENHGGEFLGGLWSSCLDPFLSFEATRIKTGIDAILVLTPVLEQGAEL